MTLPQMGAFKHFCAPCEACGSTGYVEVGGEQEECPTCEGQSSVCDCEAAYDAEGDRRYSAWKNGDHNRE